MPRRASATLRLATVPGNARLAEQTPGRKRSASCGQAKPQDYISIRWWLRSRAAAATGKGAEHGGLRKLLKVEIVSRQHLRFSAIGIELI